MIKPFITSAPNVRGPRLESMLMEKAEKRRALAPARGRRKGIGYFSSDDWRTGT
jgi:hypothetical protein